MTIRELIADIEAALRAEFPDDSQRATLATYGRIVMVVSEVGNRLSDELPYPPVDEEPR